MLIKEGVLREHNFNFITKEKKALPTSISCSAMKNNEGKLIGIIIIAQDIRDKMEIEAQLIQSAKLSALGELTAGVAHELNQPLNGIKIISQSILRDIKNNSLDTQYLNEDLNEIVNQVNRMADIIDHMRIFSRKSDVMSKEPVDLNSVIENACSFLKQQLRNHNIELNKELNKELPKIVGDQIRLEQVILNLLSNARNALEKTDKKNKRIDIILSKINDNDLMIEVKDNGTGIPEVLLEKIFQPFFTTSEPGKGTGLGLSISNTIIEEHNGNIKVESKLGEGSTFKLTFPIMY